MENTEKSNHNGVAGKIIGSLLVGAAIGGALGILFAPDKGSKTRKKIVGKTNEMTKSLKGKINSLVDETKNKLDSNKLLSDTKSLDGQSIKK